MLHIKEAIYDTECYPNYWSLGIFLPGHGMWSFEIRAGQCFSESSKAKIIEIFDAYLMVDFNGLHYDLPMIRGALMGFTCEQMKILNDQIIVHKVAPWKLGLIDWKPRNHIDIMNTAPGTATLKEYGARCHFKKVQDLPYPVDTILTEEQIIEVRKYRDNDIIELTWPLYKALAPQIKQREILGKKYGLELRSKSDPQVAEDVLKSQCEKAVGRRLYKNDIDYNLRFRYEPPEFIRFQSTELNRALQIVKQAVFGFGAGTSIDMPPELKNLTVPIGSTEYQMGIGGLHSKEKQLIVKSDEQNVLRIADVASYYPKLIINSGGYPAALGPAFRPEYQAITEERLANKKKLPKLLKGTEEYELIYILVEGGKISINGTFGKLGSAYSILFAPSMLIQTTITGQLSILMLIEWLEHYGIKVVSANTDGIVTHCPRNLIPTFDCLIKEWERVANLTMECEDWIALYARDVNTYFGIKNANDVKRKGEYARSSLVFKKNPDVEICGDAVQQYLVDGTAIEYTVAMCTDIRKFITMQKVSGGAVKLHGEGYMKGDLVRDMMPVIQKHGWIKSGRMWEKGGLLLNATDAYKSCFPPRKEEFLGKVVRWYYAVNCPGPIVYAENGNLVGNSNGAKPCMELPDILPNDIDYDWYIRKCYDILIDIGVNKK